jgi:hypothetical protein
MGTFSFRNFEIGEQFKKKFKDCEKKGKIEKFKCEIEVRKEYKSVENGRLLDMAMSIFKFVIPLDADERDLFKKKFKDTFKIVDEYAILEERERI